jgi:2-dehydro-3-deoxyphosphogluconate aldolase/(4S)-4-hydroxy-2-oxoglutarate aldolase
MPDGATRDPAGVVEALRAARVVPVVTIEDAAGAVPLAEALVAGGLPSIEITLRTPAGIEALRAAVAGVPGALVGAGTVLSAEAADAAIDAGARFVVTPGLVDAVVETCRRRGVLVLPGVATPTELLRVLALGCAIVKLFPAAVLGGPALIRSLTALGTGATFVPTGGITLDTAPSYLALPEVVAVGGSWMVPGDRIAAADWDAVRALATASSVLRSSPG